MTDLRKAAEMALEALHNIDQSNNDDAIEALRQALNETPPCKTHPDAPHGFDRNASHNADRYVCECEGWEPVDAVNMSQERVDETVKREHDLWIAAACLKSTVEAAIKAGDWKVDGACDPTKDLQYLANCLSSTQARKWIGLTDDEKYDVLEGATGDGGRVYYDTLFRSYEAKLKEKNGG